MSNQIKTNRKEQELINGILKNNKSALSQFDNLYRTRVFNFILKKIGPVKDAEEILQDTLMSTIISLPRFKHKSSLFTFICSIARHEIADYYRKKKIKKLLFSHFPSLEKIAVLALDPEGIMEKKLVKQKVKLILKKLNEGYRNILRLKYIEEKNVQEIANILSISYKAAESKLARARRAFAHIYVQNYSNPITFNHPHKLQRSLPLH